MCIVGCAGEEGQQSIDRSIETPHCHLVRITLTPIPLLRPQPNNPQAIDRSTDQAKPKHTSTPAMPVSVQVLRDSYVQPKQPAPLEDVELAGVDVLFKRMNLRFAYFFPQPLNATVLKASLAEVRACVRLDV